MSFKDKNCLPLDAKVIVFVISMVCCFILVPIPIAEAEWFTNFYIGIANTKDAEVELEVSRPSTGGGGCFFTTCFGPGRDHFATKELGDYGRSFTFGARIGYWSERLPWFGYALDVSSYHADARTPEQTAAFQGGSTFADTKTFTDIKAVDINVIPVTLLLMLRWPLLVSREFPKGQVQPYIGIGGGLFLSRIKVDLRPTVSKAASIRKNLLGADLRGGVAWQFNQHFGIFGEYRVTRAKENVGLRGEASIQTQSDTFNFDDINTDLATRHFITGMSIRF